MFRFKNIKKIKKNPLNRILTDAVSFKTGFSKFRRHVVIKHTGESGIKCLSTDCPTRFSSKDVFGAHITRHHPDLLKYVCLICNQSFKNTAEKRLHQTNCTRKRIECYLCYQTTSNMKKLRIHMVHSHTGKCSCL